MSTSPISEPPDSPLARYLDDKKQPLLMLAAAAAVIAVVVLFMALTRGDEEDTTWDASPSVSTCKDFREVMNDAQRTDIASKVLHAARAKDSLTPPSDDLVDRFADGLATACEGGDLRLDEAGVGLCLTERATFGHQ